MRSVKGKGVEVRQMCSMKTNANEPLMKRHNDPNCHQNREGVYVPGRVRRLPDYRPGGGWREGGVSVEQACIWNLGTCRSDVKEQANQAAPERLFSDAEHRGGSARSSDEAPVMGGGAKGLSYSAIECDQPDWEES